MDRRTALKLVGGALSLSALPPLPLLQKRLHVAQNTSHLFFLPGDLKRIRANAETALLKDYFQECLNVDFEQDRKELDEALADKFLFTGRRKVMAMIERESLVYLIKPDQQRSAYLLELLEVVQKLDKWDYFLEGEAKPLGFQLAPQAAIMLLFAKEVLGDALSPEQQADLLHAITEKGCVPCYNALYTMEHHPDTKNWRFDPDFLANYDIDMSRWPIILDGTNLKAIPCAGLGLGALALRGRDKRADDWLDLAVHSTKEFLAMFSKDGSYFEGVSYSDYSMRNLFVFMEAHQNIIGDIDWFDLVNFYGYAEYIACLQMGEKPEKGKIDVVNFSDANASVHASSALWVANRGRSGLAQYVAENYVDHRSINDAGPANYADRRMFTDLLWYRPEIKAEPPGARLLNKCLDLDWVICRSGWDKNDNVIAFRSGMPANHEHADRNSFIFKAFGERLLTDPYGAAYDWRQPKWLLRLTEAHNAVLVDGKGHQYHKGEEGTNASHAEAHLLRYVDRGEIVWWCSDATQAYQLVDADVDLVMRSVLFLKPDVLVIFDQLRKKHNASTFAARFHPENSDGMAALRKHGSNAFWIERPHAVLLGKVAAEAGITLNQNLLDIPKEDGIFPYFQAETAAATSSQIVTALQVSPRSDMARLQPAEIARRDDGWQISITNRSVKILTTGDVPEFVV